MSHWHSGLSGSVAQDIALGRRAADHGERKVNFKKAVVIWIHNVGVKNSRYLLFWNQVVNFRIKSYR